MGEIHLTDREQQLYDALGDQNDLVARLQDLIGYVSLHIDARWVLTRLTTDQKELWADAVEAWQARLHADEPDVLAELRPFERWWRSDGAAARSGQTARGSGDD